MRTHVNHSTDSEHAILGALLRHPDAIDRIGALKPKHFHSEAHSHIMAAIIGLVSAGKPVDAVTVAVDLHARGLEQTTGGLAYLGELAANSASSRSVKHHADIVIGKAMERELIEASETIREVVTGNGSTKDKLSASQAAVMAITESITVNHPRMLRDVLIDSIDVLEQRASGDVACLSTGFTDIDRQLSGGMRPGNLLVLAGRPGMGKTGLGLNVAYNASRSKATTLFLSLEMPQQELSDRLIAQAGSVYLSEVIDGNMAGESGDRIMAAVASLQDLPLVIDDQGGIGLFDVTTKARSVKRKHGLDFMVIDYLQLMSGEGDNRNQEIERITRGLKTLAKELNIPIMVLSQLSRKCEERTNKRPLNSDLRESGAIEQDADVILFVYRDEEYNEDSPDKGTAEVIISKNRQGRTGMVRMAYQGCYTRFADLDKSWKPEYQDEQPKRRGFR